MIPTAILFISPFTQAYWRRLIWELGSGYRLDFIQTGQFESVAREVDHVLEQLLGRVSIIAACMGGYVALEFCARRPDLVDSIGLLAVSGEVDDEERRVRRQTLIGSLESKIAHNEQVSKAEADNLLPWMLGRSGLADASTVRVAREALANPFDVLLRQQVACGTRKSPKIDARAWRNRVVALIGDQDRISSRASADKLAIDLTGAPATLIRSCGHMLAIERPRETAEALMRVLPTGATKR